MDPVIAQRKRPVTRVGPRLVGLPPDEPGAPAVAVMELEPEPEPPKSAVTQAQEIVLDLMEAVADVEGTSYRDTDKKVKQIVRDTLSSPVRSKDKPSDSEELPINELEELPAPEAGFDSFYDPNVYQTEISKALASARRKLRGPEGRKDFEDLEQIVAIEIWKATRHYGDKMNEKLAYRIAKNQADKFLKAKAEEPTFLSVDDKPENIEGVEQEDSYAESLVNKRNQEGIRPGTRDPFSLEKLPETADWLQALHEHGGRSKIYRRTGPKGCSGRIRETHTRLPLS